MIEFGSAALNLVSFGMRMAGRRRLMWLSLWLTIPANIAAIAVLTSDARLWFVIERVVFLLGAAYGLYSWSGTEKEGGE